MMEKTVSLSKLKTQDLVFMGVSVALMAICSWISIPGTVPFTLQTLGVFLVVSLLGGKKGSLAVITYVLLGALGAPVFAKFSGGIGAVFGLTGGYIFGFIAVALVMWLFEAFLGRKFHVLIISSILGMLVCYTLGTAWYMYVYGSTKEPISLALTLSWCVYPFLIPDAVKIVIGILVGDRIRKATPFLR